jgi:aerobic C4-dicarboxylate transport protein
VLRFANSLFGRVVIALVVGIVLGTIAPDFAVSLRPFGDGFVKLIQMIIAPLVFCVVVSGICGAGDLKKVAKGDILQVLVFAILFGAALLLLGDQGKSVTASIGSIGRVLFKTIGLIIKLAPLGVLGAVAFTTGKYGVGSLGKLGLLVLVFYASCLVFVLVVLGVILRITGFSILKFIRYLREELLIVLGTASSDAVLPQIMRKLEYMGIKDSTVGLVIPTGYSFNLDGFSIYLTLAVIFIAQATNTPLSLHDLAIIIAISLVTSKGAHGIPGSAIVILAATLTAVPAIPVIGLVLILPVDWFIGIGRALTNLLGNCVATVVIATWEKDIDSSRARVVLDGKVPEEVVFLPEDAVVPPAQHG